MSAVTNPVEVIDVLVGLSVLQTPPGVEQVYVND